MMFPEGVPTIWITGLPGSGKTTLGYAIIDSLEKESTGPRVQLLDGDEVREQYWPDLGFSHEDRRSNVVRTARLARMLVRHRVLPAVCLVSPEGAARRTARHIVEDVGTFVEVYLHAPMDTIKERRPSFYEISYDVPESPDFTFDTSLRPPAEMLQEILAKIR